jgi:hypothetical protein
VLTLVLVPAAYVLAYRRSGTPDATAA